MKIAWSACKPGFERLTVAASTLNFSVVGAISMGDSSSGPAGQFPRMWVWTCVTINVVCALLWLIHPDVASRSTPAKMFGVWADIGTASVLLTFASPGDALIGCNLFVVTGVFYIFFLDRRWLLAHLVFCTIFIVGVSGWALYSGNANWPTVLARADVVIAAVLGLPITIQVVWKRTARQAQHAHTDPLTGVLNRRGLNAGLHQLLQQKTAGASTVCVVADIDRFKAVNDVFGHSTGDEVLTATARSLSQHMPPRALLARTGGEEFAIVFTVAAANTDAVLAALPTTVATHGIPTVTISAGAVILPPGPLTRHQIWDTLARADATMYQAKNAGGGRLVTDTSQHLEP